MDSERHSTTGNGQSEPGSRRQWNWGERHRHQTWFLALIAFGIVLFLLVQARFLLITLVIALILFSLTSHAISWISGLRIGSLRITNWLASIFAVLMIAAGLLTLSGLILSQINTVLSTTLIYTEQAQVAIAQSFAGMGEDVQDNILRAFREIDVGAYLRAAAGSAGNILSAAVLVTLFVGFLFAERPWFSTKMEQLFPEPGRALKIRVIIAHIVRSVDHYLLVKAAVSAVTGVMIYVVALLFGVDFAVPLGILTFVLNFIPSIGSIIATVLVGLVALVQFGDPTITIAIFLISGVIQFVNGNIIDPMLMGRTLQLSSFGIIFSLTFWGAVWGVPGMFLSVPIMVTLMIICAQIPALRPVAILLSREGLPPTIVIDPLTGEPSFVTRPEPVEPEEGA